MSWFNLPSLFFPIPANFAVKPQTVNVANSNNVFVPETTLEKIDAYYLRQTIIPDYTPLYIIRSASGNHMITSEGHLVDMKNIRGIDYNIVTKQKSWFSSKTHTYVPYINIGYEELRIGNIEFHDRCDVAKFIDHVQWNMRNINN